MLHISPFYVALWGILLVVLAFLVVRERRQFYMIGKGEGDDTYMKRVIRVHANASEYVPMAAILLVVNELMGLSVFWLNLFGILFTAARIFHAIDYTRKADVSHGRMWGTITTWAVIVLMAVIAVLLTLVN